MDQGNCLQFWLVVMSIGVQIGLGKEESSLAAAIGVLTELLVKELPPKGEPFPTIPGPHPNDHICIVGAGPSGIHMAVTLKEKGFTDITIFEKTKRVGGKSYDTQIAGNYRFQGSIFLTADYFANIVALAKKYNVGELHPNPVPGVGIRAVLEQFEFRAILSCL